MSDLTLAVLLVAAVGALAGLVGAGIADWVRWLLRSGGIVGALGLGLCGVAAANLAVPRTCDRTLGERDRPAVSLVVGGKACRQDALGQVALPFVVGTATSAVVALGLQSRSGSPWAALARSRRQ